MFAILFARPLLFFSNLVAKHVVLKAKDAARTALALENVTKIGYWQKSTVYKLKNQQSQLAKDVQDIEVKKVEIEITKQQLVRKQDEMKAFVATAEEKVAVASKYNFVL